MKKYMMLALLSAVYMQANLTQLEDLEQRIQEREAALPALREQLKKATAGSAEARQLRNKINQSEEFVATGRKELAAREGSGIVRALPVFEEEPNVIYANIPPAPALPAAPAPQIPSDALVGGTGSPQRAGLLDEIRQGVKLRPTGPQVPSDALFGAEPQVNKGVKRQAPTSLRDQLEQAVKKRRTSVEVEDDIDNDVDSGDWD